MFTSHSVGELCCFITSFRLFFGNTTWNQDLGTCWFIFLCWHFLRGFNGSFSWPPRLPRFLLLLNHRISRWTLTLAHLCLRNLPDSLSLLFAKSWVVQLRTHHLTSLGLFVQKQPDWIGFVFFRCLLFLSFDNHVPSHEITSFCEHVFLGGGNSNIFYVHPEIWGNNPILTNIFQMGWFNHQLVLLFFHISSHLFHRFFFSTKNHPEIRNSTVPMVDIRLLLGYQPRWSGTLAKSGPIGSMGLVYLPLFTYILT